MWCCVGESHTLQLDKICASGCRVPACLLEFLILILMNTRTYICVDSNVNEMDTHYRGNGQVLTENDGTDKHGRGMTMRTYTTSRWYAGREEGTARVDN